ncbi:MAG: hypothetical protein EBT15_09610 [Betaproteobacteria bacterium]|nr:hypothetical protein [Betaproteobacteria bacterium]
MSRPQEPGELLELSQNLLNPILTASACALEATSHLWISSSIERRTLGEPLEPLVSGRTSHKTLRSHHSFRFWLASSIWPDVLIWRASLLSFESLRVSARARLTNSFAVEAGGDWASRAARGSEPCNPD